MRAPQNGAAPLPYFAYTQAQMSTLAGLSSDRYISAGDIYRFDQTAFDLVAKYTQKKDFPLATKLHDALVAGLGLHDEEFIQGGYGMTVFGNTVSALTEGYYITNRCEAELYLYGTTLTLSCDKTLYPDGDRVDREAQLQVEGLSSYFGSQTGGKGGKPR